jgi:hypothetical protein
MYNTITGDTLAGGSNVGCPAPTPTGFLNTRYFIYNKLEALQGPGDWFYDTSSQTLYFDSPTHAAPAAGAVTVKQRQLGFDLETNNISYTTIDGLNVFGTTIRTGATSQNNTLDHLDVNYPSYFLDITADPNMAGVASGSQLSQNFCNAVGSGATTTGVVLHGNGNVIRNSHIANSSGNGVLLWNNNRICQGSPCAPDSPNPGNTADNNVIENVSFSGSPTPAAVLPIGDNNTITHNTMRGCGRSCVAMVSIVTGGSHHNLHIAYNDMSGYCRLNLDCGAIYSIVGQDFSGSRIDHNWMHDPEPLVGIDDPASVGIYIDGSGSNIQIDNNVGWNNVRGLLAFNCASCPNVAQYGIKIYNNDGGGYVHFPKGCDANGLNCNEIKNNIGYINLEALGAIDANVIVSNNYPPAGPDTDGLAPQEGPVYLDPRVGDFRLQATVLDGSGNPQTNPARNAAVKIAGVTGTGTGDNDSSDSNPSLGAYQYGAPRWVPGASIAPASSVVHLRYSPKAGVTAAPDWGANAGNAARTSNETSRKKAAAFAPTSGVTASGAVRLSYVNPVSDPSNPAFANLSNLAIDSAHVYLFARSFNHSPATANVTVSSPLGQLWDAGNRNFDSTGGLRIDLTSKVAGTWSNLPAWLDVTGAMTAPTAPAIAGAVTGVNSTAIWLFSVELDVTAHCINATAAPCV